MDADKQVHGSRYGYTRLGCRCPECSEANAIYHRNRRHRYWPSRALTHGKASTYINYRCRCAECSAAMHMIRVRVKVKTATLIGVGV